MRCTKDEAAKNDVNCCLAKDDVKKLVLKRKIFAKNMALRKGEGGEGQGER